MFFLILAAFIWSTSFIAGKFAYQYCDPYVLVQLRLIISALVLIPWWKGAFKRLPKDCIKYMLILALLNVMTFLLQFVGLSKTSASSAVAMLGIEPIAVIIIGMLLFKEKSNMINIGLAALAIAGVWIIVGVPQGSEVSIFGCLLVLSSTFATALWVHISKKVLYQMNSVDYTVINVVLSSIACIPFTLFFHKSMQVTMSWESLAAIIYLSIVCSLIALWIWNKGLVSVNANYSGIFLALEPAFGVILSHTVLKEVLPTSTILGAIMVLLAATITVFVPISQDKKQTV